jgi:hypothetical protein
MRTSSNVWLHGKKLDILYIKEGYYREMGGDDHEVKIEATPKRASERAIESEVVNMRLYLDILIGSRKIVFLNGSSHLVTLGPPSVV